MKQIIFVECMITSNHVRGPPADRAPDEFDILTKNCNSDCVNDRKVISSLFLIKDKTHEAVHPISAELAHTIFRDFCMRVIYTTTLFHIW